MRFYPAEPDIATIFNRIMDGDIDLQPDFQRGEVWPLAKQQRLIDSILRGWVIPPILVISGQEGHIQQVLDGQQRLAAVRDFKLGRFKIDGEIDPYNEHIFSLNNYFYNDLPVGISKYFDKTTIRIYEVRDFSPEEPAEIFFRLNQPTSLTPAEKRNAFYGPVRTQIRDVVSQLIKGLNSSDMIGFSNSRMALDDIISRFACSLELNTLRKKVTAASVDDMYRRNIPISMEIFEILQHTINLFCDMINQSQRYESINNSKIKLNKATTHSWLLFLSRQIKYRNQNFSEFFNYFETSRIGQNDTNTSLIFFHSNINNAVHARKLINIYNDRATSRVADISSVILRDFILWALWIEFANSNSFRIDYNQKHIIDSVIHRQNLFSTFNFYDENKIIKELDEYKWGEALLP